MGSPIVAYAEDTLAEAIDDSIKDATDDVTAPKVDENMSRFRRIIESIRLFFIKLFS